jgi:hypothetical protein
MAHVSPSQIETWRGCQRKWAYSRIRPRSENVYALFGTRVHDILERWLADRVTPDHRTPEGLCALAAVPEIPPPQQPGAAVEHAFAFVSDGVRVLLADIVAPKVATCNGHTAGGKDDADALANAARAAAAALGDPWVAYVGRIDLLDDFVPGARVRVTDYKSCGDLARADETRGDFEENVQRVIYSVYVRVRFEVASVVARWLYLRRDPPKAEAVEMIEGGDVMHRFKRVHERFSLPIVRSHGRHPTEAPRNLAHCYAYGPRMPCPHLAECHATLSPVERAAAMMSAPDRGRKAAPQMNDLMAQLGASLAPAAAAPAAPAPAPVDPFAGWTEQDKQAYDALTNEQSPNRPAGATTQMIADYLAQNGKQHVVAAAGMAPVSAPTTSAPQPVSAPQASAPAAPSPSAPAPRVRAKSLKVEIVENMLRAVLAGAGHSVAETEQHIARLLG